MIEIHAVTNDDGVLINPAMLAAAETVHRQLRPNLPADYVGTMQAIFARGGRMTMAVQDERIAGIAVWRVLLKTVAGLELYVDDLVTDETQRSTGVGKALLQHLESEARRFGCSNLALDSGTQRHRAHRFYFREGMSVLSFRFVKILTESK
jgi:GNAT superfamily N-acetyltransferase